jgi:hypothetical protein
MEFATLIIRHIINLHYIQNSLMEIKLCFKSYLHIAFNSFKIIFPDSKVKFGPVEWASLHKHESSIALGVFLVCLETTTVPSFAGNFLPILE